MICLLLGTYISHKAKTTMEIRVMLMHLFIDIVHDPGLVVLHLLLWELFPAHSL